MHPISGFSVRVEGGRSCAVDLGCVVSYGIRRCEFDHYLLERTGARTTLGRPLEDLRREAGYWVVNGQHRGRWLVGAGGHFCPVARHLGARPGAREPMTVLAAEIEFEMKPKQRFDARTPTQVPELRFTSDLAGYGWVVPKGHWLNVGLGRQGPRDFSRHCHAFLDRLEAEGRIPEGVPRRMKGHAYLLYGETPRPIARDGALLVGDAAGMANGRSGEGIGPAVETGLLAAQAIRTGVGRSGADVARRYEEAILARFGRRYGRMRKGATECLPKRWRGPFARWLMAQPEFARRVVIERWFLQRNPGSLADGPLPRR
jgi:flavin-dependent dehydrogenase